MKEVEVLKNGKKLGGLLSPSYFDNLIAGLLYHSFNQTS
jgi:hypothetical protein